MPQQNSLSFRRPWMFMSVDSPAPNYTWLAEYMAQHDLPMDVALEHLAIKMKAFLNEGMETLKLIEGSDPQFIKNCEAFVGAYKPTRDFYAPIPMVPVVKE